MKITEEKGKFIPLTKKQMFVWLISIFLFWCLFVGVWLYHYIPEWKEWRENKLEEIREKNYEELKKQGFANFSIFDNHSSMNVSEEPELSSSEDSSSSSS